MGRFIYCLILHEDQNISSWELDMTIRLLRLDVGVHKLATTEALERLQSTAVLHVVSPYRELGRLAEVRAVLQCSAQLQSSAITTPPPALLTAHLPPPPPQPRPHKEVSLKQCCDQWP